jgi:hypothetical protein
MLCIYYTSTVQLLNTRPAWLDALWIPTSTGSMPVPAGSSCVTEVNVLMCGAAYMQLLAHDQQMAVCGGTAAQHCVVSNT